VAVLFEQLDNVGLGSVLFEFEMITKELNYVSTHLGLLSENLTKVRKCLGAIF